MRSFRIRLMLALIAGITVVSLASTYFEVLAHKHVLRRELVRHTTWIGQTIFKPGIEQALAAGRVPDIAGIAAMLRSQGEALGLAVYDARGALLVQDGPAGYLQIAPARHRSSRPSRRARMPPPLAAPTMCNGSTRPFLST